MYTLSQNVQKYANSDINYGKKLYIIDICGQGYRFFGIINASVWQNHQKYAESYKLCQKSFIKLTFVAKVIDFLA